MIRESKNTGQDMNITITYKCGRIIDTHFGFQGNVFIGNGLTWDIND